MLHFSSCSVGLHENIPWTNSLFRSVPTLHSNLRTDERPTLETSASFTCKVIARGRVKLSINVTRFSEVAEIGQVTQRRGKFQQLLLRTQVCNFETTEGLVRVADVYRPLNGNFFFTIPSPLLLSSSKMAAWLRDIPIRSPPKHACSAGYITLFLDKKETGTQ